MPLPLNPSDASRLELQRRCSQWALSFAIDASRIKSRVKRCLQQASLEHSAQELDNAADELRKLASDIRQVAQHDTD